MAGLCTLRVSIRNLLRENFFIFRFDKNPGFTSNKPIALLTLRVFARNLLRGNRRKNIFFIFRFDTNPSFTSNKPTGRSTTLRVY